MSHFTVLVVGKNIEEQLEPFWELDLTQEEAKNDIRSEFITEFKNHDELKKNMDKVLDKTPTLYYEDSIDFIENYYGYIEHEGKYGYFSNPNAKWDWYQVGGRWTGFFKPIKNPKFPLDINLGESGAFNNQAKDGFCDSIRLCDIDFDSMISNNIEKNKRNWKEAHTKLEKGEISKEQISYIYDIKEGETKKEYCNRDIGFTTYSILKDGEWHEKGKMGFWGISTDENENWKEHFKGVFDSIDKKEILTIVDCHI